MLRIVAPVDIVFRHAGGWWRTCNHRDAEACTTALVVAAKSAPITEKSIDIAIIAPGHRPQIAPIRLRIAVRPVPGHAGDDGACAIGWIAIGGGGGGDRPERTRCRGISRAVECSDDICVRCRR